MGNISINRNSCYRRDPYLLSHLAMIGLIAYLRSVGNEVSAQRLQNILDAETANRAGSHSLGCG